MSSKWGEKKHLMRKNLSTWQKAGKRKKKTENVGKITQNKMVEINPNISNQIKYQWTLQVKRHSSNWKGKQNLVTYKRTPKG